MVVIKLAYRIFFLFLFLCIGCKKENKIENQDSIIIFKKRIADSILLRKKNLEQYTKTIAKNKLFLESLIVEKINFTSQSDYNSITSVLLKTPIEIDFTYLHKKTNRKGIIFENFGLQNYLEYEEPYKEYSPFINQKNKQIDFIICYDENTEIPLKISFKNGEFFWFGKNFKWITPLIKIKDRSLTDYQDFNQNSFSKSINQKMIKEGLYLEFNKKKFLLFNIENGMWNIHHLFDVSVDKDIKYYILNSIYTREEGYGDFNNDGMLDFKQKYYLHRNNNQKTKDEYKIYTLK